MTKFKSDTVMCWQECGEMRTFTLLCIKLLLYVELIPLLSISQPTFMTPDNFRQIE